jgi:hypothetical protein
MKKQLIVALGLAVLATPAFATRARLLSLGENANGSFYINDNRNMFLNAAEINNNKDFVTYELNEQAGVVKSINNMVYGLQMNNGSSFDSTQGLDAGDDTLTGLTPNSIDLFVGGDMGVKWGANLTYVNGSDDAAVVGTNAGDTDITADSETKAMDLNVGVQAGDIKGFVKYGINGESTYKEIVGLTDPATKATVERDQDLTVGGSYQLNAYTIFGQYNMNEYTSKVEGAKTTTEDSFFTVGAGRQDKLNDKVTLFTKASYVNSNSEIKDDAKETDKGWSVPVVVGIEVDAASWVTFRTSASQDILSGNENKTPAAKNKSTNNNSIATNAGASLKFGEFSIDGLISAQDTGNLTTDTLLTTASMTYKF